MNNFMNALENETNKRMTLTDNGALAYETSGKKLLDFLFATTALRKASNQQICREFSGVYFEDPLIANKFAFWLRDCRGGNGERRIFRNYLVWLAENKPEVAKAVIPLVPEYARWDDLLCLLDTDLKDDVCNFIKYQLDEDIVLCKLGKNISILAKWMPSLNASSNETRRYAEILRSYLRYTPRQYRKMLSTLRSHLDVVEVKTSANRWGEINYETVPSQANVKYANAFMRHDEDRRIEYLESLKKGEAKINANVLQPHEIVRKYTRRSGWSSYVNGYDEALEQLWNALPVKSLDNTLVVRDGSSSMCSGYGTTMCPLDVATALAIYMADHNHGIWKDKFITFSASPKFIDLSNYKNLHDKLVKTYHEDECSNTDIERTMMLILKTAIDNNCSQEDMPKNVAILTDMQFDYGIQHSLSESLFDEIARRYKNAGYKLPRIIFWNLSGSVNKTIPMQQNELGVVLMSGFSVQLLDMVMSGETDPYKVVLETINSPRYDAVEEAVKDIC